MVVVVVAYLATALDQIQGSDKGVSEAAAQCTTS